MLYPKLMNYMATRRACVLFESSSCGGTHGKHVWEVAPDTAAALAGGIVHLLEDPLLRDELGEQAFGFVLRNHDRRQLAKNVCKAYQNVLKGTRRELKVMDRPPITYDRIDEHAIHHAKEDLEVCQ